MSTIEKIKTIFHEITDITDFIDTDTAAKNISNNIYFRGPNVWILAFSIIIASVGLNVNSPAVIIGAMLVSPLMGPIIGIGLGMGTNNTILIKKGLKHLIIMVIISLIASFLYFFISPLELPNPTELEARTNPTIYDVLIAFFGGLAGIFELSRKDKGTVLSGVAIATALMPPLCTAGYGLAYFQMNYFFGALFLFAINGVFIAFATYIGTKYLGFKEMEFSTSEGQRKTRNLITFVIIAIMVPSIWSAFLMVRDNRFSKQVATFVADNKNLSNGYIYDYKIDTKHGNKVELFIAGGQITEVEKDKLLREAEKLGMRTDQLIFKQYDYMYTDGTSEKLIKGIYEKHDAEINRRDKIISDLRDSLKNYERSKIPYTQLYRELYSNYPEISDVFMSKGVEINEEWQGEEKLILFVKSKTHLNSSEIEKMTNWLRIRMNDSTAVVLTK